MVDSFAVWCISILLALAWMVSLWGSFVWSFRWGFRAGIDFLNDRSPLPAIIISWRGALRPSKKRNPS
jgi:hypothetical protein